MHERSALYLGTELVGGRTLISFAMLFSRGSSYFSSDAASWRSRSGTARPVPLSSPDMASVVPRTKRKYTRSGAL